MSPAEPWAKAAPSPEQALGSRHPHGQRYSVPRPTLRCATATAPRASRHGKPRCLWSLSGFSSVVFPPNAVHMFIDISLHRHPFFPNSLHFRLYILGFDLLH